MKTGRLTNDEKILIERLRTENLGYKNIAKVLNCKPDRIRKYCQRNNLGGTRGQIENGDLDLFLSSFHSKYGDRFIYISGFKNCESIVKLKCKKCNEFIYRSASISRRSRTLTCEYCVNDKAKVNAIIRDAKKELNRKVRKMIKDIKEDVKLELTNKFKEIGFGNSKCFECYREFVKIRDSQKYCSNSCASKSYSRRKDIKRRIKMTLNGEIENISLSELIKRDNNLCHICGGQCDSSDYIYSDNGYFIVGKNYPSIDHLFPISKGGTHTWENVKLAHHYCNTLKSNKENYIHNEI